MLLALLACTSIDSVAEAEAAWIGFDGALSRALDLGLDGYASASSANIETQAADGDVAGTMTVDGQVDQGSSDNKGLRLSVGVVDYVDVDPIEIGEARLHVAYTTDTPLDIDLQLRDMPAGTLTGTVAGTLVLAGDLVGPATLDLAIDGRTQDRGDGLPEREPGSTTITGTVTGPAGGEYPVEITR